MRGRWINGVAAAALFGLGAPALAQDAAAISVGQTVAGALETSGETDRHRIALRGGQGYRFTLESAPDSENALSDPYLRLLDAGGAELAVNDDAGGSLNSRIDIEAPADGVYYLEAGGFGGATGAYVLGAIERALPTDAIPASAATASRLLLNRALNGSIDFDGDADWHRIDLRPGGLYRISLNAAQTDGLPDPYLRLLNAAGEELASNDDANQSLNSEIQFAPTAAGVYYVEARNLNESGVGAYTLIATRQALPADAVRGDAGTRARLDIGAEVLDTLDFPRDADWRRVTLQAGQTYRFSLESAGDSPLSDPLLRLLNARGEELARDDDGGPNLNSALEFTPAASGTYFLEARGFQDDATGGYRLRARQGDIPADATTDVAIAADGDYIDGQLSPAGDKDWYAVDLSAGSTVRLRLLNSGAQPVGDPLMTVYDSAGAEVARDDDSGGDLNAYIEFTPAAGGRYYIEAAGYDPQAQGGYALQLQPGEIGADMDNAESLSPQGAPAASQISPAGDSDWYAFSAVEGRAYRLFLDSVPGETALDPFLRLMDQRGQVIAEDDDGGAGVNAYLSFVAPESAVYYVAVSAYEDASTGRYALRAVDTETPGHAGTEEALDAIDDARVNRIDMPGDKDWYAIDVEAGVSYRIGVAGHGADPLPDPMVAIVSYPDVRPDHGHYHEGEGEPVVLASDDDSGAGRNALLTYRAERAGGVFVQVSGKGAATGGYIVTISRIAP